jgi:voltage-dependent potassium channel beta subunit
MKYRKLGNSGVRVSEISLGSWLTYGGYINENESHNIIHSAYEQGINFFDTANEYEFGEAERVVGNALSSYPRESYLLATKVFYPMGPGPNDRGLSRKHIIEQANASLRRLNMDYIDLYYCHRFDTDTPLEETLRAMDDLIRQGKVNYLGVSQWSVEQIEMALNIADNYLLDKIVVNQPYYNLLHRHIEKEIIPFCEDKGIGQVVFSPLAEGVLSGKYLTKDTKLNTRAYYAGWYEQTKESHPKSSDPKKALNGWELINEENLYKVNKLNGIAKNLGVTMAQLSLAWILNNKNVSSVIIGASKTQQVIENSEASGLILDKDTIKEIDNILKNKLTTTLA